MSYFHDAGCLASQDGPRLLIARWGPYGVLADGTPVEIHRIQEWPDSVFGEWTAFTKADPPPEARAPDFLAGMEAVLLLEPRALDMESVFVACQAFAGAFALHGAFLRGYLSEA